MPSNRNVREEVIQTAGPHSRGGIPSDAIMGQPPARVRRIENPYTEGRIPNPLHDPWSDTEASEVANNPWGEPRPMNRETVGASSNLYGRHAYREANMAQSQALENLRRMSESTEPLRPQGGTVTTDNDIMLQELIWVHNILKDFPSPLDRTQEQQEALMYRLTEVAENNSNEIQN